VDNLLNEDDILCVDSPTPHSTLNPISIMEWAVKYQIKQNALDALLKILNSHSKEFPLSSRTLMKTPKQVITKSIFPGNYHHFGLEKTIHSLLNRDLVPHNLEKVEIYVNIDGLPLS